MILTFCSAAHGYDLQSRGVLMGVSSALYAALASAFAGWFGLLVIPFVLAWWVFLRGSKQENVENTYMDTITPPPGGGPRPTLHDVLKAHYYTGWLTIWALSIWNYSTAAGQKLGWEDQAIKAGGVWKGKKVRVIDGPRVHPEDRPVWDCRRPTESATGLTGDILTAAFITSLSILKGVLGGGY